MQLKAPSTLVIFDYDGSLVNDDSDVFLYKRLCPELGEKLLVRMEYEPAWPPVVDEILGEFHEKEPHVTPRDIEDALAQIPILPRMLDALRLAVDEHGATVNVISDSNVFFIRSMLEHRGLTAYVSEVFANPVEFETDPTRLRVRLYHPETEKPHGCALCPKNMCKGSILDGIRAKTAFDRVVYVGDGKGDFCPALRLTSNDVVLARIIDPDGKPCELLRRLTVHADQVRARVVPWDSGEDVFRFIHEELIAQ
ncbi:hypothetical protein Poli38472_003573 [Pythium oligandrum]|uniref:Pyridoxal phosphate phosphatase n=1 Tax=Pythium oligandrum TaxID=41045 RepID=A0A8K1CMV2_PYTOL|nr:hypothetical protein Poli38472_003573 [Pythium oligandrum]|eukprot:TMW65808.1 hypothetical protein Poli38472_003573 [Pythium oligandrum]